MYIVESFDIMKLDDRVYELIKDLKFSEVVEMLKNYHGFSEYFTRVFIEWFYQAPPEIVKALKEVAVYKKCDLPAELELSKEEAVDFEDPDDGIIDYDYLASLGGLMDEIQTEWELKDFMRKLTFNEVGEIMNNPNIWEKPPVIRRMLIDIYRDASIREKSISNGLNIYLERLNNLFIECGTEL